MRRAVNCAARHLSPGESDELAAWPGLALLLGAGGRFPAICDGRRGGV